MSAATTALDRFERWLDARDDRPGLATFRRVFAVIWLVYDVIDLGWGMTERARVWFPHDRSTGLIVLQVILVASGAMLALGRQVWASGMIAAIARGAEAFVFFPLNDFFFGSVVYLLLAHSDGGPFALGTAGPVHAGGAAGPTRSTKTWVRDVLILELGWIYVATGVLKLNPDWLDGGQIFVRTQYLATSHGWPYPDALSRAFTSLAFDAKLSKAGAAGEIALGAMMFARGPYRLAVALAIAIHVFGAVVTNVWFFPASMAAGVVLLLPRDGPRAPSGVAAVLAAIRG
jgi:Vitamin K-dependent gamma-carboxylase